MLGFKRLLAVLAVVFAFVWLGSAAAQAGGNPGRQPLPGPDFVGVCPAFGNVTEHAVLNHEYFKTYTLADGTTKFLVEGSLTIELTGNGHTVTVNAGGPGAEYVHPDGPVIVAGFGQVLFTGVNGEGIWLYNGHVVIDGTTGLIISRTGHATDVCAMLA